MEEQARAELRALLIAERERLLESLDGAEEAAKPVQLDQASVGRLSRMDAMQGQAMALAVVQRQRQRLRRIDACLQRLEAEDFGYCADCDEPIDLRRLRLDPTLTLCTACVSARE